jgi:type VI secretion system protein ImpK
MDFDMDMDDETPTQIGATLIPPRQSGAATDSDDDLTRDGPSQAPPATRRPAAPVTGNPLVDCATELLILAGLLRVSRTSHSRPARLLNRATVLATRYSACARDVDSADPRALEHARYALCALIDEAALVNQRGRPSPWDQGGLLHELKLRPHGGQVFFEGLDTQPTDARENRRQTELKYLCLALGFHGKYGTARDQDRRLQEEKALRDLRGSLQRALQRQGIGWTWELSPNWRGARASTGSRSRWRWPLATLAIAGIVLLFGVFAHRLSSHLKPIEDTLDSLTIDMPIDPEPQKTISDTRPLPLPRSLMDLLAKEIHEGRVLCEARSEGETLIVGEGAQKGDSPLFAKGKDTLSPAYVPLIRKIASQLLLLSGRVRVTGHTDSEPIHSARFPSNQALSQARAEAVRRVLIGGAGQAERFTAEGLADSQPRIRQDPLDPRNRRVEITLMRGDGTSEAR